MASKFSKIENKEEWQGFLDRALFKTTFHSLEWEDFLESQFKWLKFERYLWRNQAILSLARVKIGGIEKLVSHPFCEYGGPLPLIAETDGEIFRQDIIDSFNCPLKISFHPKLLGYFKGISFSENRRETYFFEGLQSQSEDHLWGRIDRNRHRAIKKAMDNGLTVEECKNKPDLKKLYGLYVKNLKEHKTVAYPLSFFEFFLEDPKAEILLVKKGEEIVGGNIFLYYEKIIHSFLCGFRGAQKRAGAHSLALWLEIKKGKGRGAEIFDFGATTKTSSLQDFKQRWGAKSYPIFELKSRWDDSISKKSILRNVWGFLPSGLVGILSPYFLKYKL
jgi:hypothetical protein